MIGAIIGDIVGSPYEFDCNNIKTTEFPLFSIRSEFTDDTVMTIAVADALMEGYGDKEKTRELVIRKMRKLGRFYPNAGYGLRFMDWLCREDDKPYNSYGNGSAMRVSAVGWLFDTMEEVEEYAELTASVTHNHPEGIKGAQATAAAIFMARNKADKEEIKEYIIKRFGYEFNMTLDEIRPFYHHVESCQETVPEALTAFFESEDFEDAIRKAVSLGGDSDTLTAITGSVAEAYYGIPDDIREQALSYVSYDLLAVVKRWEDFLKEKSARE